MIISYRLFFFESLVINPFESFDIFRNKWKANQLKDQDSNPYYIQSDQK